MMKKPEAKKVTSIKENASKLLRTVSTGEGFHFFTDIGKPTDKIATSLTDFYEKLRTVDIRSINFHFARQDFEKWLRGTIGDSELAMRISRIGKELNGENLRNEISRTVRRRLDEIRST